MGIVNVFKLYLFILGKIYDKIIVVKVCEKEPKNGHLMGKRAGLKRKIGAKFDCRVTRRFGKNVRVQ
jgi:hypothetical protein